MTTTPATPEPDPRQAELVRRALAWLGVESGPAATSKDAAVAPDVAAAVIAFVDGLPGTGQPWNARTWQGAAMLAARLIRRRGSVAGIESFTDAGGAVYVVKHDPDVAMMLRLGAYTHPQVG